MPTTIAIILLASSPLAAAHPPRQSPAASTTPAPGPSFRFTFQEFDSGRRPVGRGEFIASRGKLYFLQKGSNEVVIFGPGEARRSNSSTLSWA